MVLKHGDEYPSHWAAIVSIATKIGCAAQTLNTWVKTAEIDSGRKPGIATDERERLKALERENRRQCCMPLVEAFTQSGVAAGQGR